MATQLLSGEHDEERQQVRPRAHARPKLAKKKGGAAKRRASLAGVMKWVVSSVGLIATIVATLAAVLHINPPVPPPPDPVIRVDEQAKLTRSSKNNLLELRVNLTLLNKGGNVALIPRPTVSLDAAGQVRLVPPDDLHFKFAEGTSEEVIFPVSLHEGANTFEKQIICSIAEGRDADWYQAGLLRINLDFRPEGNDPISRCLVVVPPVNRPLSCDESKCFTITDDCDAFGDGFTKRPLTKRTS